MAASGVRQPASPSMLSLFSTSSGGSTGSTSTITQESISRPRSRSSKQKPLSKLGNKRQTISRTRTRASESPTASSMLPNVFEFLEAPSRNASKVSIEHIPESDPSTPHAEAFQFSKDNSEEKDSPPLNFYSDSGISIRDSSPEPAASVTSRDSADIQSNIQHVEQSSPEMPRQRLRTVRNRYRSQKPPTYAEESVERHSVPQQRLFDVPYPEAYYYQSHVQEARRSPSLAAKVINKPTELLQDKAEKEPLQSMSGYDFLASKLSAAGTGQSSLPPLYRKFESLNHRILLQLQDEIAEMEEDLNKFDEAHAQYQAAAAHTAGKTKLPESRRLDTQSQQFSALHFSRLDLLGKIYVKVEQYSMI